MHKIVASNSLKNKIENIYNKIRRKFYRKVKCSRLLQLPYKRKYLYVQCRQIGKKYQELVFIYISFVNRFTTCCAAHKG